eukprot:scaffold78633_cov57-Phaeocystis_antarctica.AAC.1
MFPVPVRGSRKSHVPSVSITIPRGLNAGSAACCRVGAACAEAHGTRYSAPGARYSLRCHRHAAPDVVGRLVGVHL